MLTFFKFLLGIFFYEESYLELFRRLHISAITVILCELLLYILVFKLC